MQNLDTFRIHLKQHKDLVWLLLLLLLSLFQILCVDGDLVLKNLLDAVLSE